MTSDQFKNGQSVQALYVNAQVKASAGFAVDTGCQVQHQTGDLDQPDTLQVDPGQAWFDQDPVQVAQQNVRIDAGDTDPRKDVVYLDATGTAQVAKGDPNAIPANQSGATRFTTYRPSPPDLSDTDAVILAEVWVPKNASSIQPESVADRRVYETRDVLLASQSFTATGGAFPAADVVLDGVTDDQFQTLDVVVTVDADPAFAADYGFNYDWTRTWDDTGGHIDIGVQVNWDTDPGAGNDVSLTAHVVHKNA